MTGNQAIDEQAVRNAAGAVVDPALNQPLSKLEMVGQVTAGPEGVSVEILLPMVPAPQQQEREERVRQAVANVAPSAAKVEISFTPQVRGRETGGSLGLRVKNILAVGSGKGGVGKSTIAAALACGMQRAGARVGLIDADVYGPSIPHLFHVSGQPEVIEQPGPDGTVIPRMQPHVSAGIKVISMGLFIKPEQAVVWRGPMLHKALTQFFKDTDWGELDYLIVDMPPGTGDVALTLSQLVGLAGAVVVCTPQEVALLDAVKAISMFRQVKIPVLGMVENMSGEIFGRGGAQQKAGEMKVPFLGEIPIDAAIRIQGDAGAIPELYADNSPVRQPLMNMCETVALEIAQSLMADGTPQLPTLEIL